MKADIEYYSNQKNEYVPDKVDSFTTFARDRCYKQYKKTRETLIKEYEQHKNTVLNFITTLEQDGFKNILKR